MSKITRKATTSVIFCLIVLVTIMSYNSVSAGFRGHGGGFGAGGYGGGLARTYLAPSYGQGLNLGGGGHGGGGGGGGHGGGGGCPSCGKR